MQFMSYEDLPKIRLPNGNDVFISDSTLRDGAQMPGIVINLRDRLRIYEYLHRIGIEKLEVFLFSKADKRAAREMLDRGCNPEVTGWSRANTNDIDLVLEMDGIRETGILMSISDPHILIKMGLPGREAAREMYLDALQYAVDHGLRTRAHLEDITRADLEGFVYPLVREIIDIDRDCTIRICDTLGYGLPVISVTYEESDGLERYIEEYFPGDVERLMKYRALGERSAIRLKTGYDLFVRAHGISLKETRAVLNRFTIEGRIPEPVRVARLVARAAMRIGRESGE